MYLRLHMLTRLYVFCLCGFIFIIGNFLSLPARAHSVPLSFTTSGGVSLGAYEAGYLYYFTELVKKNHLPLELKGVTGASAGGINSLLFLMSMYSPSSKNPEDSLFWHSWIPFGLREIVGTSKEGSPSALFNNEAMEKSAVEIEKRWNEGLDSSCDVVIGITTTLVRPERFSVGKNLQLTHQEEAFTLRVQGRGPGKPPLVTNYVNPTDLIPHALLYLPKDDTKRFAALKKLIFATAAFPGAFPPQSLRVCRVNPKEAQTECTLENSHEDLFLDGGVFDNEPIRLAIRTAARGLVKTSDGHFVWSALPKIQRQFPPAEVEFRALDISTKTYPEEDVADSKEKGTAADPLLDFLKKFATDFISTIRAQQLYSVLEENPAIPNSIFSFKNHFPLISEPAVAFFGFIDRGFREFDFTMGMYDARRNFIETNESPGAHFPEENKGKNWEFFECLRGNLDHDSQLVAKACESPDLYNLKILLQLSLNRLYSNCSKIQALNVLWLLKKNFHPK
jgi:predicted acylesterase/phospholipase RssA